jgi:hypothetical protein
MRYEHDLRTYSNVLRRLGSAQAIIYQRFRGTYYLLFTIWDLVILRLVLIVVYLATAKTDGHVLVRRVANYAFYLRILFHYSYISFCTVTA